MTAIDNIDIDEGPVYTSGSGFRARAEALQRKYRSEVLRVPWVTHGHWLADEPAHAGANFVLKTCHDAARQRAAAGKGVAESRTLSNMLSSQAMCFNIFAPLAHESGKATAAKALASFIPALASVERIVIEHTPNNSIFNDQVGLSGVDCDVLVEFRDAQNAKGVLTIETKFVEPEFSSCGFRKKGARAPCPASVKLGDDGAACGYSKKGYRYWKQALAAGTLNMERVRSAGCPFGDSSWQLWVNHTLSHAEAAQSGPTLARFAVVAPEANHRLLDQGKVLDRFRSYLTNPETMVFIPLEKLIARLREVADFPDAGRWGDGLAARYLVPPA